jgi:hypothetical protein
MYIKRTHNNEIICPSVMSAHSFYFRKYQDRSVHVSRVSVANMPARQGVVSQHVHAYASRLYAHAQLEGTWYSIGTREEVVHDFLRYPVSHV